MWNLYRFFQRRDLCKPLSRACRYDTAHLCDTCLSPCDTLTGFAQGLCVCNGTVTGLGQGPRVNSVSLTVAGPTP